LGEEWCGVASAGCRRSGGVASRVSAAAQAGERFGPLPFSESSPDLRDPVSWSVGDFPPLPRSVVLAGAAASPQVLVGSLSVPLQGCPPVASCPSPAARRAPSGPRVGDAGDVASSLPSVSLGLVDPPSQCPARSVSASAVILPGPAHGPQVGLCVRSGPSNPLPYKWAWRPVGTLDLTLLIPTSISDLTRASFLHLTASAPRICRRSPPLPMDCNRRDGRDNWEGRPASKRSFEETLPLEERRVDTLSESELRLLLERRARQGDRSPPPRLLEAGRFEGEGSRFQQGGAYPRAGDGGAPSRQPRRKVVSSKPKYR
jgi:hypothetical protein